MAPPNVLWLLTDEQRRDSLGFYGSPWAHSPNLDRIAAEGVVFTNALTQAPLCAPGRCSMVTGRYVTEHGVWSNIHENLPYGDHLTYGFRDAGYPTVSVGKSHYCTRNSAFDVEGLGKVTTDHVHYFEYASQYNEADYDVVKYPGQPYPWIFGGRFPAPAEETAEARCIEAAEGWLEEHDRERPFFLRVSLNAPHTPVVPPEPFDTIVDPEAIHLPPEAEANAPGEPDWIRHHLRRAADADIMSPEQIGKMRRYYYGWCAHVDHQIGRLLDWMRERGLLENTIIALSSDHGTQLGDFGLVQKQTLFEPTACVPFLFWYPGHVAEGARVTTPVETRQLLPTLLELAGLSAPDDRAALSLAPYLRSGQEPPVRPCFSEFVLEWPEYCGHADPIVMVRESDLKLSLCFGPEPYDGWLVNLAVDPFERRNLYGDARYAVDCTWLEQLVVEHYAQRRQ